MKLNRRKLLKSAAAIGFALPALKLPTWADELQDFMLCAKNADGEFVAVRLSASGQIEQQFVLHDRGHGHAKSSNGDVAIFARRPNNQLYLIDRQGKLNVRYAPDDRHFYGHGVFSPNGKLLYTSENDFDNEDPDTTGVIGVWDVKLGAKIGEFSSGGIGVHQLMLMPDGETLVVANGGILTHPDHPRQKLNLDDMQPNLAFINRKNGQIASKIELPNALHQLSIRHLDVTSKSNVVVAMQYQGSRADDVPLLATIGNGRKFKFTQTPQKVQAQNKQYIGSICFDASGTYFAATSPRGNIVSFYDQNGRFLSQYSMLDVCAVAATNTPNEFVLASGMGDIDLYNVQHKTVKKLRTQSAKTGLYQWDNHMFAL